MNLFICGTESGVGKTFVTAGLAALMQSLGYKCGVYKPFQCGAKLKNGFPIATDLAYVKKIDAFIETDCSYLMKTSVVPALAAEIDKHKIDINFVFKSYKNLCEKCDLVIVEGTGGVNVPVTPNLFMSDVIKLFKLPAVIVTRPDCDVVNKTLLTINKLQSSDIEVRGVIINKYPQGTTDICARTASRLIEEYSGVRVLGLIKELKNFENLTPGGIIDILLNSIDAEKVFGIKIPKLNSGI